MTKSCLPGLLWWVLAASVPFLSAKPSADQRMAFALVSGNEDQAIRALAAGAPVEGHDRFGTTRLMEAANRSQERVVAALLDRGANVNAVNRSGESALLRATGPGGTDRIAALLIRHGADVNHADKEGFFPLLNAAVHDRADLIRLLVQAGASPDAATPDRYQVTSLGAAARHAKLDAVRALLAAGATVDKADAQGFTPLAGVFPVADHAEAAELLLRAGANPNQRLPNGKPLVVACIAEHRPGVLAALLAAKADPNVVCENMTPLLWAVGFDRGCLPILLAAKPDLEQKVRSYFISNVIFPPGSTPGENDPPPKNYHERTVLMEAAEGDHAEVVKRLLAAGADPQTRDDDGSTAADLARRLGHGEIVQLLEAASKPFPPP